MQGQALKARPRRKGLPVDRGQRCTIADNVLDRQFQTDAPNQKWVADFKYIWTAEGWLYVAAVLDLYSRRVVSWSMQSSMTSQLVADALMMAVWRRGKPQKLLQHSGKSSISKASLSFDISPFEIEESVDKAKRGMANALRAIVAQELGSNHAVLRLLAGDQAHHLHEQCH